MPLLKKIAHRLARYVGYDLVHYFPPATLVADVDRLRALGEKQEPLKLHFGCGPRVLKGWVNIDLSYEPYANYLQYYTDTHYPPSLRGSRDDLFLIDVIQTGLPLPDGSVDLVFHEDFFEHLHQQEQMIFLAEIFRVLKKGAVHRINTPNLRASMRDHSDFEKGKAGVFTGEWTNWEHYSVISETILKEMAEIVGYSKVVFNTRDQSIAAHQLPTEYRPDVNDRPAADSNVFADLVK